AVVALLAHSGGEAPVGVWDRVAGQLYEEATPPPSGNVLPIRRRRPRPWALVAVAAVVVAALAMPLTALAVQSQRVARRTDRLAALAARPDGNSLAAIAAQPGSTVVALRDGGGQVVARAFVTASGQAVLDTAGLPEL